MARAVRKKELTAEERLAAALVPEEEQPYKVPGNWCWVRVGAICSFIGGGTPSKRNDEYWNGNVPWASVKDIKGDYLYETVDHITEAGLLNSSSNMCEEDDLLLVTRIEPAKTIISKIKTAINQDLKIVKSNLSPIFLHYYFKNFKHDFEMKSSGSTVQGITLSNVQNNPLPLPPMNEQQRILNTIQTLFADLDEAKEKLTVVVEGFAQRKAAILHQAFTGELTAKWREENHLSSESWEKRRLGELGTLERGKSKHRPRNDPKLFGGPYPFVQTGDISSAGMYLTAHKQTLSEVGLQQSKLFPTGTLCITIAANIGDVSILSYDCCFPDSVVGFTPNESSLSEYVYYMMTTIQQELEANAPATAQKNINLKVLNDTYVSVPTIDEQREFVRILDDLFEQEQQAQSAVETVLTDIDTLKKSILARAFRGELSTNDPKEENAVEMLKTVLM